MPTRTPSSTTLTKVNPICRIFQGDTTRWYLHFVVATFQQYSAHTVHQELQVSSFVPPLIFLRQLSLHSLECWQLYGPSMPCIVFAVSSLPRGTDVLFVTPFAKMT